MFMDYRVFNGDLTGNQCTQDFIDWTQRTVFSHEISEIYYELKRGGVHPIRLVNIGKRLDEIYNVYDSKQENHKPISKTFEPVNKNDTDIFQTDDPYFDNAVNYMRKK
ncbi:hypothetical protein [Shewanella algae]|uniref:hypothetical protein n=1 Tax=Shewanella algae TaxID=38313 RepID=UPI0030041EA8